MSINDAAGPRYWRIVLVVRAVNLLMLAMLAVVFLGGLSFEARFGLMTAFVAIGWAATGYLLLALRKLRREAGGPDDLWVRDELQRLQQDVLFRWRRPG